MKSLFAGVAAMNTAMAGASTAATLIADEAAGAGWSGVPNAAGVLGTALGTLSAGHLIARRGSKIVVVGLYGAAVAGALVALTAAVSTVIVVLMLGMFLLGLGNGAAQLSRYLAAEQAPAHRKGFALSVIVWAGTVGAIAGPTLIAPSAGFATGLGLPTFAGPMLVAVVMTAAALLASTTLRRTPAPVVHNPPGYPQARSTSSESSPPTGRLARRDAPGIGWGFRLRSGGGIQRSSLLTPLVSMVCAQLTMVAVMTMTPLQMAAHGHGLELLGLVISVHMVGMFALAPLSGRLADRFGGRTVIYLGIGLLVLSAVTAFGAGQVTGLSFAMFLLGYGWNLVFVGGSAILSRELPEDQRIQLQGAVDAVVWGSSALASLGAGLLFGLGGYSLVAVVGGVLALLPITVLAKRRVPAEPEPHRLPA